MKRRSSSTHGLGQGNRIALFPLDQLQPLVKLLLERAIAHLLENVCIPHLVDLEGFVAAGADDLVHGDWDFSFGWIAFRGHLQRAKCNHTLARLSSIPCGACAISYRNSINQTSSQPIGVHSAISKQASEGLVTCVLLSGCCMNGSRKRQHCAARLQLTLGPAFMQRAGRWNISKAR